MALEQDDPPGDGDDEDPRVSLLRQISGEMVARQKRFWGKGPKNVKSYIIDDLVLIVMRGGLTVAERTMVDFGQHDLVRQFRQVFENEMTSELSQMIEQLAKRKVLTYQSQILFDPDVVIEIFVLDATPGAAERFAATELTFDDE
jgi:uncharacterized protein YbcI